ncbi:MAG: sensor histidine kinase [Propionicimonas sp.]
MTLARGAMITADPIVRVDEDLRTAREQFAVLEERARIARDLHDHVIQRLFGTGLGLVALAAIDPEHAEALERHIAEIDAAIADIRTAVFTLNTRAHSTSARHRLLDIVTDLTPSLATPPRMRFAGPIDLVLTGGLADDVIAVVREALTNVSRHARARTALVAIAVTDFDITVTVDDDGVGVNPHATRTSGVASLAERARRHGGTFSLEPRHAGGTRARWHVPLTLTSEATA